MHEDASALKTDDHSRADLRPTGSATRPAGESVATIRLAHGIK